MKIVAAQMNKGLASLMKAVMRSRTVNRTFSQ
jgi:hypothetical protein